MISPAVEPPTGSKYLAMPMCKETGSDRQGEPAERDIAAQRFGPGLHKATRRA
jgi:hypothetical protein